MIASPSASYASVEIAGVSASSPDQIESELTETFVVGKWEVGLRDWRRHCVPNGWMVCFCPCVTLAQISARLEPGSFRSTVIKWTVLVAISVGITAAQTVFLIQWRRASKETSERTVMLVLFCVSIVASVAFNVVWARLTAAIRTKVRDRFQIPGSHDDDHKRASWCGACVVAQMATQTKSYKPGSCDFNAPDALPAYIR